MRIIFLALATLGLASGSADAQAAATGWQDLGGGKARMVAALDPQDQTVTGVIQIDLEPGWKTYWREPGGSGIPPVFDFAKSRHFAAGEIGYPVPALLEAGGVEFAGYKEHVAFPFRGTMIRETPDGAVVLDMLAGICEEICIPATATFSIPLSDLRISDPEAIRAYLDAITRLPGEPDDDFRIVEAEVDGDTMAIRARLPVKNASASLFAEGPAGWYLRPADLRAIAGGEALFHLDIADIPAGADPAGTQLRYTLVIGDSGIEQWFAPE